MKTLREALREQRTIAFRRVFVDWAGSVNAALMLSQLMYWMERSNKEWVYKTQSDWEDELGLTRREQDTARKELKARGLIEETKTGAPPRIYFRPGKRLLDLLGVYGDANGGNVQIDLAESAKLKWRKAPNPTRARVKKDYNIDSPQTLIASGGECVSFDGKVGKVVKGFYNWAIKNHWLPGDKKYNLESWGKALETLYQSQDEDRVQEVLNWYYQKAGQRFIPEAEALTTFCEKFHKIQRAYNKDLGIESPPCQEEEPALIKKQIVKAEPRDWREELMDDD